MTLKNNLRQYIDAGYPILYIDAYEEIKTDEIISSLNLEKGLIEWNAADGLVNFKNKTPLMETKMSLCEALAFLNSSGDIDNHLVVLKDAHTFLSSDDTDTVAIIKRICQRIINGQIDSTIIIVSPVISIPKEIEKYVTVFEMDPMLQDDICDHVREYLNAYDISVGEKLLNEIAIAFKGLTMYEIDTLLNLSLAENGEITQKDLKLIFEQKRQIIMKSNTLEMINVKEKITDIGGLDNLKKWLERKAAIFRDIDSAVQFGVDMPKGVLIAGIPGCGKSLAAKATSALFEVPLLKLDMGKIMGKYLGESETNMRKAIELAETISPCVLWVDELEKAFAGTDGSGHEVTMRLFATFLTWLQEKTSPVFVVATANDISKMPPELLRKGRFDDIFYVDLPNDNERKRIFEIHIRKRRPADLSGIDVSALVGKSSGYSGADIESVVVEAVEDAFANKQDGLKTDNVLKIINSTKSLSDIMGEKIKNLRKFYSESGNFKNAT
ncbi:AAA family ATPase [Ruminococcus sp. HUN007]|uniref:AAA family ATPase n=1 Tax=Ruminococcus sp. HUN007 TaxID=1514668 RepID=UPI0005D21D51|nr:AAA family ATPase [Ruminococcus sp. HUN007]